MTVTAGTSNQVAPAGTTAQQKQDYMGAMNTAYKAGNYVICTNSNCTDVVEDIAIAGWFQLPICTASGSSSHSAPCSRMRVMNVCIVECGIVPQ